MMQPFDEGEFDKRFDEVYKEAIENAGFDAYRVDRDPGASIPIQHIESEIKDSAVCFVDISLDNPNVWFEFGYAICAQKPICIVCSYERTKFPFDVQHRKIIRYKTSSPSDFNSLKENIVERFIAIQERELKIETMLAAPSVAQSDNLSALDFTTLCVIFENQAAQAHWLSYSRIVNGLDRLGYTKLAARASLESLLRQELIECGSREADTFYYRLSDSGSAYVMGNLDKVALKKTANNHT
ncbi:hypothetical protein QEV83_06550 [Methylocapsa sp. D3K7]|uniref:hypothetical protein n=1 Tax=Methylocapsa sp. D3K7 TaxID=3041435 RepID=UPI00244EB5FA|nr:hypothetical protein [Methylocapsa sp. D3K7]WGJ15908.1 hypothetical protein QEV83_06550 [Methylocapsa sp. D3K7]